MGGTKAITIYLQKIIIFFNLKIHICVAILFNPLVFVLVRFFGSMIGFASATLGFFYATFYLFSGGRKRCIPHILSSSSNLFSFPNMFFYQLSFSAI
jgi:hypothetical protein